jgi:hypothetical protein
LKLHSLNVEITPKWMKHVRFYPNIYPTRHDVTQFILHGNCSTCFGWYHHASSGVQTTVSTASGICHTVIAICLYCGRFGTGLSVLWVAYVTNSTWNTLHERPQLGPLGKAASNFFACRVQPKRFDHIFSLRMGPILSPQQCLFYTQWWKSCMQWVIPSINWMFQINFTSTMKWLWTQKWPI